MNRQILSRVYVCVAMGVMLIGLLGLWRGISRLDDARAQCVGLHAHRARLDALAARLGAFVQARDALRGQAAIAPPVTVEFLLQDAFPGSAPVVQQTTRMVMAGWQVRDVDVALRNVSAARISRFVEAAEAHGLPLRLVRCELRSLPGAAGHVDASLEFSRVEPTGQP